MLFVSLTTMITKFANLIGSLFIPVLASFNNLKYWTIDWIHMDGLSSNLNYLGAIKGSFSIVRRRLSPR